MAVMGVHVARRRDMAHRAYEDWPRPRRWHRVQYAAAVVVQALVILAAFFGIAIVGTVLGSALGVDMAVRP